MRPGSFPYDRQVVEQFFPGREVTLSFDRMRLFGVTCAPDEWEAFINFAEYAITADTGLTETKEALALIRKMQLEYKSFRSLLILGPIKSPEQWGKLVA